LFLWFFGPLTAIDLPSCLSPITLISACFDPVLGIEQYGGMVEKYRLLKMELSPWNFG
jgi:hypothetical protein